MANPASNGYEPSMIVSAGHARMRKKEYNTIREDLTKLNGTS
jgi:hypothetical protein